MLNKKKIANVIFEQRLKERDVPDVEYSPRPGIEAVARDIISASKEGDVESLASALEAFAELIRAKDDYKPTNQITIES